MIAKKSRNILVITSLVIGIGAGSYIIFNNGSKVESIITRSIDFPSTSDLNEMIKESDIVVVGKYKNLDSKWNMARNPNNIMEEANDKYVEGYLYNFEISELIKGEAQNKSIKINHRFAESLNIEDSDEIIGADGTIEKEATYVKKELVESKDPLYIEPVFGENYMLFLKEDKVFGNYYGAIEPFMIKFDKNDSAALQTNIKSIDKKKLTSKFKVGKKTFILENKIDNIVNDTISGMSKKELIRRVKYGK